jgi:hypothetical protein
MTLCIASAEAYHEEKDVNELLERRISMRIGEKSPSTASMTHIMTNDHKGLS